MPVSPSFQDLIEQGQSELQDRRPELEVNDGDVTEADLHACAAMNDTVLAFAAQAFRDTFFDGASGDALDAIVDDRLNLQRKASTAARVVLKFARVSGGAGGTIPLGTRGATAFDAAGNQIAFDTDADIIVPNADNGPFEVNATAEEGGTAGNVKAGTVVKILDPLFDTFTVTNDAVAAGGNEGEKDEELRQRAKTFLATLNRGTLLALETGALLVPDVRIARAVEDLATFAVTVLVADEDGGSTAQMVADVTTELENWRCAGTQVQVIGGKQSVVDLELEIFAKDGFDKDAAAPLISDAVVTRMKKLTLGETAYLDSLKAAVVAVAPDEILFVSIDTVIVDGIPVFSADIIPDSNAVLRAGTVTVL